jgi:hypothetical protein
MATTTRERKLTVADVSEELGLPHWIIRRALDRYQLAEPRRYVGQHRTVCAGVLPTLRKRLRDDGYLP